MDNLGFKSVSSEVAAPTEVVSNSEPVVEATTETTEVVDNSGGGEQIQPTEEAVTSTEMVQPEQEATHTVTTTQEPVKETVYVDPFAELGDTEKSIFESIKNKDYKSLKDILDVITADYSQMTDVDLVRMRLKETKPRWTDEMIDAELESKYGIGLDDEELTPAEKLAYQRQLFDDGDAAREFYNSKKQDVKFPELTKQEQAQQQAATIENQPSPEEVEKFRQYWEGHIENSVKDLTGDVIQIEVGRDGSKETFDFPISITDTDKQSLKQLVSDFDIRKDFETRYVKDDVVDLKKFMSDRFKAENFDKLIRAAFGQGHAKGKLSQISGDKNLDFDSRGNGSSTHDQVSTKTNAAKFFLNNGRN